jgi:hypothetical protein
MPRLFIPAAISLLACGSAPALAQAGNFVLVNGTRLPMSDVAIRRFGTQDWRPLGVAPAAGARAQVSFSDPDCAFDIRAKLPGNVTAIWSGVNLCEAGAVTLNRDAVGGLWVDYD